MLFARNGWMFIKRHAFHTGPISDDILFELKNNVGIITLNRPKALNSLNLRMTEAISIQLAEWQKQCKIVVLQGAGERSFCSGGDLVEYSHSRESSFKFGRYLLVIGNLLGRFKIPFISICDGITMGAGAGISMQGHHLIATERTVFAMPEVTIGYFPNVSATYFLPRLSGKLGLFLGLTGHQLRGTDVVKANIASHFLSSSDIPDFIDHLQKVDSNHVAEFLNSSTKNVSDYSLSLDKYKDIIDRCFDAENVEAVLHKLQNEGDDWSKSVAKTICSKSPTALKLTMKAFDLGAKLELRQCLQMELQLEDAILDRVISSDFYEGVRAQIIDKDNSPKWNPKSLSDVTDDMVNKCFPSLLTIR